jgi:hypothetical protein
MLARIFDSGNCNLLNGLAICGYKKASAFQAAYFLFIISDLKFNIKKEVFLK